jgi:hypothetical protein
MPRSPRMYLPRTARPRCVGRRPYSGSSANRQRHCDMTGVRGPGEAEQLGSVISVENGGAARPLPGCPHSRSSQHDGKGQGRVAHHGTAR